MQNLAKAAVMKSSRPQQTKIEALNSVVAELEEAVRKLQLQNRELKLRHAVLENLCRVNQLALHVVASVGPVLSQELSPESQAASSAAIVAAEQEIAQMMHALGLGAAAAECSYHTSWTSQVTPPHLDAQNAASAVMDGRCLSLLEHSLLLVQSSPETFASLGHCSPEVYYELAISWADILSTALTESAKQDQRLVDAAADAGWPPPPPSPLPPSAAAAAAGTAAGGGPARRHKAALSRVVSDSGRSGPPITSSPAPSTDSTPGTLLTLSTPQVAAATSSPSTTPSCNSSSHGSSGGSVVEPSTGGAVQSTAASTCSPHPHPMVRWWQHKWQQAVQQDPAQGLACCTLDLMAILLCCNLIDPAITYGVVLHSFQQWGFPPQSHMQAVLEAVQLSAEQFEAIAAARRVHQDILQPLVAAGEEVQQELAQLLRVMQQQELQRQTQGHVSRPQQTHSAEADAVRHTDADNCHAANAATGAAGAAAAGAGAGRSSSSGPFPALQVAQDATVVELYEQLRALTRRLCAAHRTLGWLEGAQDFHAFGLLTFRQIAILARELRPWPIIVRRFAEYAAVQWEEARQQQQQQQCLSGAISCSTTSTTSATQPRACWSYQHVEQQQAGAIAPALNAQLLVAAQVQSGCAALAAQLPKQSSLLQQVELGQQHPRQQRTPLQQLRPQQQMQQQSQVQEQQQRRHLKEPGPCQQAQQQQQQQQQQRRQEPAHLSLAPAVGGPLRLQAGSRSVHRAQQERADVNPRHLVLASAGMCDPNVLPSSCPPDPGTAAGWVEPQGVVGTSHMVHGAQRHIPGGAAEAMELLLLQLEGRMRSEPLLRPAAAAAAAAAPPAQLPQQQPPIPPPFAAPVPDRPFVTAHGGRAVGCAGDLLHPLQVCEGLLGGRRGHGGGGVVLEPGALPDMAEVLLALQRE